MNLEELIVQSEVRLNKLRALNENPQPGLSTWHEAVRNVLSDENELRDALRNCLGAIFAMEPIVEKFLSDIDRDIKKEFPGLDLAKRNAERLLK